MTNGCTGPSGNKPGRLRPFYKIHENGDGTADIYFDGENGTVERVMKGIIMYEGIEEDIRRNFDKWRQSAEVI